MNQELTILNGLFKSREIYTTTEGIINTTDFSTQGRCLYNAIQHFYANDTAAVQVDIGVFNMYLERTYANKSKDLLNLIDHTTELISQSNLLNEIILYKQTKQAHVTAATLLNPRASIKSKQEAIADYQAYDTYDIEQVDNSNKEAYQVYNNIHMAEFTEVYKQENLIQVFPKALNTLLNGGLPIHTHVGVIGIQNSGKTLLAIANTCGNIRKGRRVVYCGNEEGTEQFMVRIFSRILNRTKEEIKGNEHKLMGELVHKGYENLIYVAMTPGTPEEIEEVINVWEPSLVVVDQVRQLQVGTKKDSGDTAQLTQAAKDMRRLVKKYPIVLMSLTQAGASAKGKLILEQDDCYQSNTTFSGDCDIMFGWGMDDYYEAHMKRRISLPRDKVHGKNHQWVDVKIDPFRSKINSD